MKLKIQILSNFTPICVPLHFHEIFRSDKFELNFDLIHFHEIFPSTGIELKSQNPT